MSARWSSSEIAILREHYPTLGADCVRHLPGRSEKSIHQKAFKLDIGCGKVVDAPRPKLAGPDLEEAIGLREEANWSFARIGAKFGVAEASACNAVLIALCPRKGFTPAQRDEHGNLTFEGRERVRLALRKGLKGVDIQLRLGVSASCVAEQRRRYRRDLDARGKAPLPPPGGGEDYSGRKLPRAKVREVEGLLLDGFGTARTSAQTGVEISSCKRIRNRLIRRLARKGEALPGCDRHGRRIEVKDSAAYVHPAQVTAFRKLLLDRMPVRSAAYQTAIGSCSAYVLRDQLRNEMAAQGFALPRPDLRRAVRGTARLDPTWPPRGLTGYAAFRDLLRSMPFEAARERWRADRRAEIAAEARRPKTFEEQLARIQRGEIGLAPSLNRPHLAPLIGELA